MENLIISSKYLMLTLVMLLLSACSNTYFGIIQNETNDPLNIKLTFENEYGTRYLELEPVKARESEAWYYEQSSFIKTKIDKNLVSLEATNSEECTITFDRAAIEKNVENHRQQIIIEPQDFIDACGEKAAND